MKSILVSSQDKSTYRIVLELCPSLMHLDGCPEILSGSRHKPEFFIAGNYSYLYLPFPHGKNVAEQMISRSRSAQTAGLVCFLFLNRRCAFPRTPRGSPSCRETYLPVPFLHPAGVSRFVAHVFARIPQQIDFRPWRSTARTLRLPSRRFYY